MLPAELISVKRVLGSLVPRRGARWRVALITCLLLAATGFFAWLTGQFYPLRHWLFFYYARAWLLAGLFSVASLSAGLRILGYVVPESLRLGERLVLGFALGVLAFFWGVFLAGLGGLFGTVFFWAWPAILLLAGGPNVARMAGRAWVHLRRFGVRLVMPRGPVEVLGALLIVLSLAAVYLQVMTPCNVGADANAYHIPIAEHYAAAGRIRPFADGWYNGAFPQLASVLFTWAYQAPGDFHDHLALSSHLEWALFLPTLAGVAVLAGRLGRTLRLPFAGAAVFLFPGIYLYDSSLITGADHVLAFWAVPLALALLRAGRRFSVPNALLVGAFSAAVMLTKYQGIYLFVPAALFMLVLWARARRMAPLLAWGLSGLVLSTAFWLKNWVFYGDPLFPLLHDYLPSHPFHAENAPLMDRVFADPHFVVTGTPAQKLVKTLKTLVTFSFQPNDWGGFHGDTPVFGSLFTLLVPVLLFLRAPRRLWLLVLGSHLGVAVWYLNQHQDRYLQALLPWMAACTAVTLQLAWQHGPFVRTGVVALVALQLVWGSDVYFIRTHAMLGDSPIRAAGDLLGAAYQHRYEERFARSGSLEEIGRKLPGGATVLVHDVDEKLGARSQAVLDNPGRQGAIEYLKLDSPRAVKNLWRKLEVTHVVYLPHWAGMGRDDLAREAIFDRTIYLFGAMPRDQAHFRYVELVETPKDAAQATEPTRIAWLACHEVPSYGIYTLAGLRAERPDVMLTDGMLSGSPLGALAAANAMVLDRSCPNVSEAVGALSAEFEAITRPGEREVWVRTRAHGP
jgi:hypothetical protein